MWFRFTGTTLTHKPASRQIITPNVSACEIAVHDLPVDQAAGTPGLAVPDSETPVLMSASTPGAAMGLATRKP